MLEKMTSFHSVSGIESEFREWLKGEVSPYCEAVEIDKWGNLVARKGEMPAVGLFVHMDSVGFMVKKIDKEAIEVVRIGNPEIVMWTKVIVLSTSGEIPGVFISRGEGEKCKFFVDVGITEQAKAIRPGDYVVFADNFTRAGDLVISRGLDNKIGCLVALDVFKRVKNAVFVGTIGEEQEPAGASVAVRELSSLLQLALILDVTYDENIVNDYHIKIGQGPVICLKDDLLPNRQAADALISIAQASNIPYQVEVLESGGTDARNIASEGIPFVVVGVPIRYMHTPCEIANFRDIENAIRLVAGFLEKNGKY